MSNQSATATQLDFDFWEFVCCGKCNLPFESEHDTTPQIPFWLTECGHVLCNSHLNADQSCSQCLQPEINLIPLQHDMESPMGDWFRPVTQSFDTIIFAAKYQQETMAAQIRYYKKQYLNHRKLIDRLKREAAQNKILQRANEELKDEIDQLRQHVGNHAFVNTRRQREQQEPSEFVNLHGKRQMLDRDRHSAGGRGPSTSSPRSVVTPMGPNRLTLPPGQNPPTLSRPRPQVDNQPEPQSADMLAEPQQRPGSSRFAEMYSYVSPQSSRLHPQQLSHAQAAPIRQSHRANDNPAPDAGPSHRRAMMGPPPTTRFRPVQETSANHPPRNPNQNAGQLLSHSNAAGPESSNIMGNPQRQPPKVFNTIENRQDTEAPRYPPQHSSVDKAPSKARRSFFAPRQQFVPQTADAGNNRSFVPSTPSAARQRFASSSGIRPPSSAAGYDIRSGTTAMSGGHRMPFVPGPQGRFG